MSTDFHIVIPARYQSSRFPGKLLKDLHGCSVLERVFLQGKKAKPASIVIATDHQNIAELAESFGATVQLTSTQHQSGTDRIAEVIEKGNYAADDIIVNVQGDEPFIAPELISQVANNLSQTNSPVSTLCWPIDNYETLTNKNIVKVVRDKNDQALYFSRAPVPFPREHFQSNTIAAFRHIGLYAYRAAFLLDFVQLPACDLETIEALEQLRILWSGVPIEVKEACVEPLQDINTPTDLLRAQELLEQSKI